MNEPHLVFAETSPYGSVEAIIEQDGEVAFFYLRSLSEDSFGMKSCWIRNLVDAPEELDRERLAAGNPPVVPAKFCRSPDAQPKLNEKELRVVWFTEGDGAALLENDDVIAIIPAWSGMEGFDGYSKECLSNSPFGWALPENRTLFDRIVDADRFWNSWQSEKSPWDQYEPRLLEAFENKFGPAQNYFSIDGGNWPPKTLAQFESDGQVILATVGVSICPQPKVELAMEIPGPFRRFELAACFDETTAPELVKSYASYMSAQVSIPWQQKTFLAHGHSVSCRLFLENDSFSDFSSVFLISQDSLQLESRLNLPEIYGDPVNLLWTVPVFEHERKRLQESNNLSLLDPVIHNERYPLIRCRSSL